MQMQNCMITDLPKIQDPRGNLTFLESKRHIPFVIQRVYWIYDVPGGETRGGHAYNNLEEFIIALSGSFDVAVDNGSGSEQIHHLNRSYHGLYIPRLTWRQMRHFSTNSVALILASLPYSEDDYIYSYNDFLKLKNGQ